MKTNQDPNIQDLAELHAKQHQDRNPLKMPSSYRKWSEDQPKPTGEWTAVQSSNQQYPHEWDVKVEGRGGYSVIGNGFITKGQANAIADAHNAALAAVDRVAQAWEDDARLYAKNSDRYREEQTLVDALIKIANDPHCDRCQVAVNALANVKEGK